MQKELVLRKVDVKERLPESNGNYIVYSEFHQMKMNCGYNKELGFIGQGVTHWYEEVPLFSVIEKKTEEPDNKDLLKGIDHNDLLNKTKEYIATQNGFESWAELLSYYEDYADRIDPEEEATLENIIDDVSCKYGYDLSQIVAKINVTPKVEVEPTLREEEMKRHIVKMEGRIINYHTYTHSDKYHLTIEVLGYGNYLGNNIKGNPVVILSHDNGQKGE